MAPAITPAYLNYLKGELADQLDEIYKDDVTPVGRAFRDKFQFTIQTYCQQHDQAGEQTASFAEQLPCNDLFDVRGALSAKMILEETHAALVELLQDDADFLDSYRGDNVTNDETDRSVRTDAREFTKRNEVGPEIDAIVRTTAAEGEATEKEVADAAYGFKDGARTEYDVALSARDRLDPNPSDAPPAGTVPPPKHASAEISASVPPSAIPAASPPAVPAVALNVPAPEIDRPAFVTLKRQTFFGQSPSLVFNRAKQWFADAIISVAAGSEKFDHFPRIAPLIDKPELGVHATTYAELMKLARDIRDMTRRLRPPLSERFDDLMGIMESVTKRPGGGGPSKGEIDEIVVSFTEMFGKPDDDKYGLGLNKDWDSDDE